MSPRPPASKVTKPRAKKPTTLPAAFRGLSATKKEEMYDSDVTMEDSMTDVASGPAASAPFPTILGLWKGFIVSDDGGKLLHIAEDDGKAQGLVDLHKEGKKEGNSA